MSETRPRTSDSHIKGIKLKSAMNIQEFCKDRIDEILMLTEALNESPFRGQAFQRLPKHMRRRQMSHYIKRLPRRLRNSSLLSTPDDVSVLPKRPSRKYRRRPANLLLEYNRRKRKSIWLETHIWHARRFHMTSKWGYSLPEKPTNKSFRACYRAVANHCFISDISYYGIIELSGNESVLLKGLQQCVSTSCGLTFAAKMFRNGSREGYLTLYHPNSFPYSAIGEVSFLWKPIESEDENRTIWIFVHPSIYNEITDVFKTLFSLSEVIRSEEATNDEVTSKEISHVEKEERVQKSAKGRIINFHPIPEFINVNKSVTMKELKNKLNRFRLTGPLALAVVSNAFDVIKYDSSEKASHVEILSENLNKNQNPLKRDRSQNSESEPTENAKRMKMDVNSNDDGSSESVNTNESWWNRFYKTENRKKILESQANFYKRLANFQTPSELPPGMVLSLVVRDPRLTIPSKRMKCTPNAQDVERTSLTSLDPSLCCSSLWEADMIEEICNNKIPTAEINRARAKLIVPGSDVGNILGADKQAKVPLIIIQRTGLSTINPSERHDFGSGLDIIVPPGWAMPVWLSLIYRGARPGGLRETESMSLESKNLSEYIQPDSLSGEAENLEMYDKLKDIYFKRPPCKRPNFAKIGVKSPFYFPWKALVRDWSQIEPKSKSELKFYVLRDLKKLSELNEFLRIATSKKSKMKVKCIDSFTIDDANCLVPICVESCRKGASERNAVLCLPTHEDIKEFKLRNICPAENHHADPNFHTRKVLKREHVKELKSLKRKRRMREIKKAEEQHDLLNSNDKEGEKSTEDIERDNLLASKDIVDKYNAEMRALWLKEPQTIDTVMNSCSRTLFGYVVLGGFSFSHANGMGLGYVTLRGLLTLLKRSIDAGVPPLVLFRNNNVVEYRFGKIQICMNSRY